MMLAGGNMGDYRALLDATMGEYYLRMQLFVKEIEQLQRQAAKAKAGRGKK